MVVQSEKLSTVFGKNLRTFREALNLSQKELGSRLGNGIGPGYISDVELGKTSPTLRMIARFSEALGVEPNVLLSEMPSPAEVG